MGYGSMNGASTMIKNESAGGRRHALRLPVATRALAKNGTVLQVLCCHGHGAE
jgi:hypothetical protein